MALSGELSGLQGATCSCGRELKLRVLQSNAGYYLGYRCGECGPFSRETGYYKTYEEALKALLGCMAGVAPANVRTTEYTGGE